HLQPRSFRSVEVRGFEPGPQPDAGRGVGESLGAQRAGSHASRSQAGEPSPRGGRASRLLPAMLSIIMPACNEAELIGGCVRQWDEEVVSRIPGSELIVVDDCSADATGRIVAALGEQLPGVRCVRPARNGGHGKALRFGFDHATQAYIFQTDSD